MRRRNDFGPRLKQLSRHRMNFCRSPRTSFARPYPRSKRRLSWPNARACVARSRRTNSSGTLITSHARTQDVTELLEEIVERYRTHDEDQTHQFQLDLADHPLLLHVDTSRLEQVLDNFLSNAVKYSPTGGVIRIAAERQD